MSMEEPKINSFQIISANGTGIMGTRAEVKMTPLKVAKPEQNLNYEVKWSFESIPSEEGFETLSKMYIPPTFMSGRDKNGKELWKKEVESIEFSDAPDNKVNIEVTLITEDTSNLLC